MPDLVDLPSVKDHLNFLQTDTSHDVELQGFISAATATVEYYTGPILPRSITETHRTGGASRIVLRHPPVLTVDAVSEYIGLTMYTLTAQPPGSTLNNYGYNLDFLEMGVLRRMSSAGTETGFLGNAVVVSYTAGLPAIPADVRLAALEDIRGLYVQTQLNNRPGFGNNAGEDGWTVGPMELFPRLADLLGRAKRTQTIA